MTRPASGSPEALKVRGALMQKGLSVKELADRWGVSPQAIYYALSGVRPHSVICMSVSEIVGFWPYPEFDPMKIYSMSPRNLLKNTTDHF